MSVHENDSSNAPEESVEQVEEQPVQVDEVKNLKSEFGRKFENVSATIAETNRRLEEMMAAVIQSRTQEATPAPQQRSLKDLVYDDPEALAETIVQRATSAADRVIEQRLHAREAMNATVQDISSKYPEFVQSGSEAERLAIQKAANLPKHLKGTPEGAKLAMMEVVAELALVPQTKRQAANSRLNDDFSLSGSSSQGSSRRSQAQDPKKSIDPATLAFAELIGVDVNDPKRLEGLAKASQRKNWNRYS